MLNWLIIIISLCTQTNVGNIKGETENIIDNQIEEAGTMTFEKYRKDILNKTNCDLVKKIVPVRGGVVWLVDKNTFCCMIGAYLDKNTFCGVIGG